VFFSYPEINVCLMNSSLVIFLLVNKKYVEAADESR